MFIYLVLAGSYLYALSADGGMGGQGWLMYIVSILFFMDVIVYEIVMIILCILLMVVHISVVLLVPAVSSLRICILYGIFILCSCY